MFLYYSSSLLSHFCSNNINCVSKKAKMYIREKLQYAYPTDLICDGF